MAFNTSHDISRARLQSLCPLLASSLNRVLPSEVSHHLYIVPNTAPAPPALQALSEPPPELKSLSPLDFINRSQDAIFDTLRRHLKSTYPTWSSDEIGTVMNSQYEVLWQQKRFANGGIRTMDECQRQPIYQDLSPAITTHTNRKHAMQLVGETKITLAEQSLPELKDRFYGRETSGAFNVDDETGTPLTQKQNANSITSSPAKNLLEDSVSPVDQDQNRRHRLLKFSPVESDFILYLVLHSLPSPSIAYQINLLKQPEPPGKIPLLKRLVEEHLASCLDATTNLRGGSPDTSRYARQRQGVWQTPG